MLAPIASNANADEDSLGSLNFENRNYINRKVFNHAIGIEEEARRQAVEDLQWHVDCMRPSGQWCRCHGRVCSHLVGVREIEPQMLSGVR